MQEEQNEFTLTLFAFMVVALLVGVGIGNML